MKKIYINIKKVFKDPFLVISFLASRNYFYWVSDEKYLKMLYYVKLKKKLNLSDPKTFNEKLQWLKLHDRNPLYIELVDKYEVRKHISEIIGEEYLIPLLGVWDNFDDIDFSKLPNQFVLKCTHDSGGVVICKDKSKFNINEAKDKINKLLKRNYYYVGREWPYRDIKPRIICEKLLKTKENTLPSDYKFHCFNGEPDSVMVCTGRETGNTKFYFLDKDWKLLDYNLSSINAGSDFNLEKPNELKKMFNIAKKLSSELPFVRVDLYYENEKIYFGELTFFPQSGFDPNLLETTDLLFGDKIFLNN